MSDSSNGKVPLRGGTETSKPAGELITPEMFEEAKIRGVKQPQTKTPNGVEKKKETAVSANENPLMAKLREAMEKAATKTAEKRIKETQSVEVARATASDAGMVRIFLDTIKEVQKLVVLKMTSSGGIEKVAREQVDRLNTSNQVKLLGSYASDDTDVQDILASLEVINSEARTRDALYGAIDRWYKPLVTIGTMERLDEFLVDCLKAGMVNLTYGKKPSDLIMVEEDVKAGIPAVTIKAVTIKGIGNDKHYLPKPEKDEAVAGWTFCKEAEEWAIKNWEDMKRLRDQATPGLTPYLISRKGEQGNLFVPLSLDEAVLLEVRVQGGWTTIRCIDSVGLEGDDIPDGKEYQWDDHRKTVANPMSDAWIRVAETVNQMAHDQFVASRERFSSKEQRTKPLVEGTTVGSHFKDQGLTRVLQGDERAIVAMWRFDHSWNNKEGFLGCRIRWQDGILLEAVVYDHFFPKQLLGMVMPITIDQETLQVKLDTLPRKTDKQNVEYTAWKMLEVFLNARLKQEVRELQKSKGQGQVQTPAVETATTL